MGSGDAASAQKMDLKDFAAHCGEKFNVRKVEPWNRHFRSTDAKYLAEFRASVDKAHGAIVPAPGRGFGHQSADGMGDVRVKLDRKSVV